MKETGKALPSIYRETSGGGIAEAYRQRKLDYQTLATET